MREVDEPPGSAGDGGKDVDDGMERTSARAISWDDLPGAQVFVDQRGRIESCSRGFLQELGLRREPAGFELSTFVASQDRRAWKIILEGSLVEEEGRRSLRMIRSDGTMPWMDLLWRRHDDGVFVLFEDTTAHHQLEERLRQRDRRAAVGRLAEAVLRDLSRQVGRALQALEEPGTGNELPLDPKSLLRQAVRQIHAFQESSRQGGTTATEGADLESILRSVRPMFLAALGERRELVSTLRTQARWVRSDASLLEHLLLHLALWGADRTPANGVLRLDVTEESLESPRALSDGSWIEPGTWTVLHLADQGVPLGEEALDAALESYPVHGARGLLAPVREAVRRCGGHVILSSVPGGGVEVRLFLPPLPVVESSIPVARAPSGPSILVVEDRRDVLVALMRILETAGYEVQGTTDPLEAVRWARQTVFDMIVTDLDMPGMGGLQLIRELREENPGLPSVIVSGYGDPGALPTRCAFLHKPVGADDLLQAVRLRLHAT